MLLYIWMLIWSGNPDNFDFAALDPKTFQIHELDRIYSPTSVLRIKDRMFLGADLLEPKPGIYRLNHEKGGPWHANLVCYLPQQEIENLLIDSEGAIHAASGRFFSAFEKDWASQVLSIDSDRYRILGREHLPIPNACGDGNPDCGLVAAWPLSPKRWLAVSKKRLATLYILDYIKDSWQEERQLSITVNRKYPVVTELKVVGDRLIFLLRDRWMIAETTLSAALSPEVRRLELTPCFDFSAFKRAFAVDDPVLSYNGIAEGFDFDGAGNLYLVLNNRGHAFRRSPNQVLDKRPKLVIFPRKP